MKNPFFSIVIPTRNRHETLPYTISTILQQDCTNFEIIICDNNSTAETKDVVNKFQDQRIKYIRVENTLSMTDNFELAVSYVNGEYITTLADNDGFIQGSLAYLQNLLIINNYPEILRWQKNYYFWPDLPEVNRNYMHLFFNGKLEIINGDSVIIDVLDIQKTFSKLPTIYNSVVSKTLLNELKSRCGRFFNSVSPDIYTGFAFAHLSKKFFSLGVPITIGGTSSKSNGYNALKKSNKILKEFESLSGDIFHKKIPNVHSNQYIAAVYESFLHVKEDLNLDEIKLEMKEAFFKIIKNVIAHDTNEIEQTEKKILLACEDDRELNSYVKTLLLKYPIKVTKRSEASPAIGIPGYKNLLILDAYMFDLKNIFDVSVFMSKFYEYSLDRVGYPTLSSEMHEIGLNEKIAIWGKGHKSEMLLNKIKNNRSDLSVAFFIDSFQENLSSEPPILTPDNIKFKDDVDYLIIASMFVNDIKNMIQKFNLQKIILIYDE